MYNVWRGKDEINVVLKNRDRIRAKSDIVCFYCYILPHLIKNKNIDITNPGLDGNGFKFEYMGRDITLEAVGDIFAVYGEEAYKFLNVNNETVIDIGANIGDSSIYFALNNARKVIALEPYPYSYNIALKNIKLNHLEDKIILLNAGYGEENTIKIDPKFENTTSSDIKSFDNGIDIKIMPLKKILNDYNIDNAVLKMDCEGCEYNIIKEDNDTLRKFKMIQMEYHYGYEKLKDKLEEAGFNVKYTEPKVSFNPDAKDHQMSLGYIYAKIDL